MTSKTKAAKDGRRPSAARATKAKNSASPTTTRKKAAVASKTKTTKASREIYRVVDQAQDVITEITVRARDAGRALAGKR